MDSQQPIPPAGGFNPQAYDFIMNPDQPKKPLLSFGGGGKQRTLIMLAVGLLIITILIIIGSMLLGGMSSTNDRLKGIVIKQTEIIRIAELGKRSATGTDAKSLAASTHLVISSDQSETIEILKKNRGKISNKELATGQNQKITETLKQAESNGTFDTSFTEIITDLLTEYQVNLETAYDSTKGNETKRFLAQSYDNAKALIETMPTN